DHALRTFGRARDADVAPMQDQPMMRVLTELRGHELQQAGFDVERILARRNAGAIGDAKDMRVHGDGCLAERDIQHDVGRFAADARKLLECLAALWYLA